MSSKKKTEFSFNVTHSLGRARVGTLQTPHGGIETPAFVPVGTQATVKSLTPHDLEAIGTQMVLANTYHLYLQPGWGTVSKLGGLHQMMRWDRPVMTDSGGFQVFSLGWALEHDVGKLISLFADDSREEVSARVRIQQGKSLIKHEKLCVVDDLGATFRSHLDGSVHRWTPEKSMIVQKTLGADLIFALDECTSPLHDEAYTKESMRRSHLWEDRSLAAFDQEGMGERQALFGIVQGGRFEELRKESARFVGSKHFFGNGIGGALVDKSTMKLILGWIMPILPEDRPHHLLGIGTIDDILSGVEQGVDLFDCAYPTRIARRGDLLMLPQDGGTWSNRWRLQVTRHEFRKDARPVSVTCSCELCRGTFSRGYLHHLFWAKELLAYRLASIHNLAVMHCLMDEIREGISEDKLAKVRKRWMG